MIIPNILKLNSPEARYARNIRNEKAVAMREATMEKDTLFVIVPFRYVAAIVPSTNAFIGEPLILNNSV